jgi:hypothetical protein
MADFGQTHFPKYGIVMNEIKDKLGFLGWSTTSQHECLLEKLRTMAHKTIYRHLFNRMCLSRFNFQFQFGLHGNYQISEWFDWRI